MGGQINIELIYNLLKEATIIFVSMIMMGVIASSIRTFIVRTYIKSLGPKMATFVDSKLTFIGVIHHELSHMLLAMLSGAKVTSFKLFKIKDNTLGHVDMTPRGPWIIRSFQLALCGTAPVICGCVSLYLIYYYGIHLRQPYDWVTALLIVLMMQISYHMSMSKQDVKVSLKGLWVIYLILVVVTYFIEFNFEVYKEFLIIVFCIQCINLILTMIIKIIAGIFNK